MADIGALIVKIGADASELQAVFSQISKQAAGLGDNMKQFGKMAAVAASAGAAFSAAFLGIVKTTADTGDQLQKMSEKVGVPVEVLSQLSHVAKLADTDLGGLQKGMGKLARMMSGAEDGGQKAAAAFEKLHIATADSEGKLRPLNDVFLNIADRFATMQDETQRAAYALQFFGKSGLELIPMLVQGRQAIQDQMEEAKRLGTVWSGDDAQAAERFNDNVKRLEEGLSGITQTIGKAFIPVLADVVHSLQPVLELGVEFAKWFQGLDEGVKKTVAIFAVSFAVGGPIVLVIGAAITAISLISAPLLAGGAIILGLMAGTAALIANWQAFKEKAVSLWTGMKKAVVDAVNSMMDAITTEIMTRIDHILAPIRKITKGVEEAFQFLKDRVVGHSIIPDMVNGIAMEFARLESVMVPVAQDATQQSVQAIEREVKSLDIRLGAAQRTTVATMRDVVAGMSFTWEMAQEEMLSVAINTWGQITNTVSNSLAQNIVSGNDWAQTWKSLQTSILATFLNTIFQMTSQWIVGEVAKTAATQANNTARMASDQAAAASTAVSWQGATATAMSALGTMAAGIKTFFVESILPAIVAVGEAIAGFLSAVAAGMMKTVFGIPVGVAILASVAVILGTLAALKAIKLAEGGVITAPTLAMIGEAGPEAVIPLKGSHGLNEGLLNQNVKVEIPVMIQSREVARATVNDLMSLLRLQGVPA